MHASLAASRTTARLLRLLRFHRPHEGAHKFFIDLRRDRVDVNARCGEKFAGIFDSIDASRLNLYLLETGSREFGAIFTFIQRASHATNPRQYALADLWRHFSSRHHIRYRKA